MQLAERRQFSMPCGNGGKLFWWEMQQQLLSRTSGVPTPLPPFSSRRTKIDALLRFVWCVHFLFLYLSLDIRTHYIHTYIHTYKKAKKACGGFDGVRGGGMYSSDCAAFCHEACCVLFLFLYKFHCQRSAVRAAPWTLAWLPHSVSGNNEQPASVSTISADANGICLCIFITNQLDHPLYRLTA